MIFRQLYDMETGTFTYLLGDETTRGAVLIDPVLEQVDRDLGVLRDLNLNLEVVLDTHTHADHITGSGTLRQRTGARIGMSENGPASADLRLKDGDFIDIGDLRVEVLATPGHTDDSLSFRAGNMIFTGDTILLHRTGRSDFQNGDAGQLYDSVARLLKMPAETFLYPGHDYTGRMVTTVGEERRLNTTAGKTRDEFVALQAAIQRPTPARIDIAVPANLKCGVLSEVSREIKDQIAMQALSAAEPTAEGYLDMDPAVLSRSLAALRVIDVREESDDTIPGSEHIPTAELERRLGAADRDAPIVVVCRSGNRSKAAARLLTELGFSHVANLKGGVMDYAGHGFETVAPRSIQ